MQSWTRAAAALALALVSCDRRIEPFDPAEQPAEPELSKIFPPGSQPSARAPGLPPRPGAPALAEPPAARAAAAAGEPIEGSVALAAGLEARVPPGATLFLIARHGDSGPPLAVKRIAAPRFPLEFRLGSEDRMLESLPFEGPLRLSARLDADGNATTRSPGDLQGAVAGTLEPGARGVRVVLDEVL